MQSCYPWQCREALALLRKNPLCDQIAILFRDFWVDSNLEGIYWLRVAGHASPHWLSLESSNFRVHPVVCPRTGRLRGDLPHPCLVTEIPFRACWFPQVTLLLEGFVKHRPDCLVHLGGSDWAVVQIDGGGHKDRLDALKDKELGLPVLRLSSADVFSTRLFEKLKTLVSR